MRVKEFIDYVNYNDFYNLYDVEDSLKSYLNHLLKRLLKI